MVGCARLWVRRHHHRRARRLRDQHQPWLVRLNRAGLSGNRDHDGHAPLRSGRCVNGSALMRMIWGEGAVGRAQALLAETEEFPACLPLSVGVR